MKRYLFTTIGMTDPISNFRDGSMLHIIRYYKPDRVYAYMTKEISDISEKDNSIYGKDRYTFCIEKIREVINKDFSFDVDKDIEMYDPSAMDVFYKKFLKKIIEIEKIAKEETNDDYEILLNVSSGTPAQKATLQMIASLGNDHMMAIQVKTPAKKSNEKDDNKNEDIKVLWETNEDNMSNIENRCIASNSDSFIKLATERENIKELIKNYDYSAVYEILCNLGCDDTLKTLLKNAVLRYEMNLSEIGKDIASEEKKYFILNVGSDILKEIEYILSLQVKIKKSNFIDFVRGITPIIADLFERYINMIDKNLLESICVEKFDNVLDKKRIIMKTNKEKIKEFDESLYSFLEDSFKNNGGFKDGELTSSTLLYIMKYYYEVKKIISKENYEIADKLRTFEQKIRNIVAHEIEYMTAERIKDIAGISVDKVFKLIIIFANLCNMKIDNDKLMAYDKMNEYIINHIEEKFV